MRTTSMPKPLVPEDGNRLRPRDNLVRAAVDKRNLDVLRGTCVAGICQAHNLKVVGSNPTPATKIKSPLGPALSGIFLRQFAPICRATGHSAKCY
jgi:hypothetical protein